MLELNKSKGKQKKLVVLLLIDAWGVAPANVVNAITMASTPTFSNLCHEYPLALLNTASEDLNSRYLIIGSGQRFKDIANVSKPSLSSILSEVGLNQAKVLETERLAALSYFFNGQVEEKLLNEKYYVISSSSPKRREAHLFALGQTVKKSIELIKSNQNLDFIAVSLPYLDLISVQSNLELAIKAVTTLDNYIQKIVSATLFKDAILIITSPAGNLEHIHDLATGLSDSKLTNNPVPLLIVGHDFKGKTIGLAEPLDGDLSILKPAGDLSDVAPTILDIIGLGKADTMSGHSLLRN